MKKSAIRFISFSLFLFMAACSILPPPPAAPARYDFGPLPQPHQAVTLAHALVRLQAVTAPDWLAGTEMHYRLLYNNPNQLRSYADNRWTVPVAELFQARLLASLNTAESSVPMTASTPRYNLYIYLAVCEQDFSAANSATVGMQINAVLRDSENTQTLAEQQFGEAVASAPNARGASEASASAADKITADLIHWIDSITVQTNSNKSPP